MALPTADDPLLAASSQVLGGPAGTRAVPGRHWWGPVRIGLAVACGVLGLGVLADAGCRQHGWADRGERALWTGLCYSDVPFLYRERGLADGRVLYLDTPLEYPVLTGAVMQVTSYASRAVGWLTDPAPADPAVHGGVAFYDVTVVLMAACALVTVVATTRTVPRRPWDGLLVAAAPVLLLTSTINWDLLPAALTSLAVLCWTRQRPLAAGVLIGLGAAAKLYPALLLGAALLVCLRSARRGAALRAWAAAAAGATCAWVGLNLPVYLAAPEGWRYFWTFNDARGAEFGSPWYALGRLGWPVPDSVVDPLVLACLGTGLAALAVLALVAPRPPRLAQVAFLAVAVFVLTNKVWSPQYALWLLPLAALARPRWRDLLVWQAGEAVHFVAVWLLLASYADPAAPLITDRFYALVVALRAAGLLWLAGVVVRDVLVPDRDPVRPFLAAPARVPG